MTQDKRTPTAHSPASLGRAQRGATVRLAPLAKIPGVLRQLGFSPEVVLGRLGYSPAFFEDPDLPIPYVAAGSLLAHCVAATGCGHFGLLLGEQADPSVLGLAGFVLMNAPDVGTALHDLIRFLDLHDRGGISTLETVDDISQLGFVVVEPGVEATTQIYDLSMAIACNIMRSLCGPQWNPAEVLLPRRRPVDVTPWKVFFRSPVRFDAGQSALAFPATWLRKTVAAANPALHKLLEQQAVAARSQAGSGFAAEVRRIVQGTIAHHTCHAARVSGLLGMHERTLNRRLQAEGTSFMQVRDEALYGASRQLLGGSSMNLSDIADALGYADATTFIRAFTRWSGQTPMQWRRAQARRDG